MMKTSMAPIITHRLSTRNIAAAPTSGGASAPAAVPTAIIIANITPTTCLLIAFDFLFFLSWTLFDQTRDQLIGNS